MGFLPRTHICSLIMGHPSDQPSLDDIQQRTWPVPLKTAKVRQNKERLKNCQKSEETGNLMTKCNVGSWKRKRKSMDKLVESKQSLEFS